MADDLNTQITIGADASGVEAGVGKAKRSLKDLGDAAARAGKDAADGVRKVGDGSDKAAQSVDRATKTMTASLQRQIAAFEAGGTASREYQESLAKMRGANVAALKPLLDQLDAAKSKSEAASKAAEKVGTSFDGMSIAAGLASRAIASIGIAASVQSYFQAADAVTALTNSLKLATGSTQAAATAYESLFTIAQRSRVNFVELGNTYASISRATGELGVSQSRMLKVTESIANAMTISGGSAQGMNAALTQLSQGMASGTLRGEELNSILEQAPRLAKALADGLGVPIGKLREMGQAGEITSQQIVRALESQSEVLSKEVTTATITLGQAFTQLSNSGTKAVGEFDKASGASTTLAQAISSIAGAVDTMGAAFKNNEIAVKSVMGALTGAAALATLAAIPRAIGAIGAAITGLSVVLAANPAVLALLGVGAVVGGGLAAVNSYSKTERGIKEAVASLEEANVRSEAALKRAVDGGRTAGADNIRATIEERKKAIRELNAEIALMNSAGLDNRVEEARLAAGTEQFRAQRQAAEELAGIKQKLSGVDKDYLPTLNKLYQQYQDGNLTLKEYQGLVAKLADSNYKADSASKSAASSVKAEQDAYRNLITSIKEKIAANELELSNSQEMTESQKILIKLDQELLSGKLKLTAASEKDVRARIAILALQEKEIAARREAVKTSQAAAAARTKETDGIESWMRAQEDAALQSAKSITDRISGLAEEEKAADLARDTNISLAEAIERVHIARLREKRDGPTGAYKDSPAYKELTDEIELRERLAQGIGKKDTRERNDDITRRETERAQQEMQRYIDETKAGLGDAIETAIFDGSKAGGERMREVLQEALLRKPLRMLIDGVLNQVTGGALQLLGIGGGGGLGGAAGGGNNLMGMASNAYSLYNGASSAYTLGSQYLGGTMSGANALGSMYANATGAGLDGLLATNAAFGTSAQSAIAANLAMEAGTAPALAAGTNAAGGAAAGSWGAGGIAALIMLAVINALGGMRTETQIGSGLAGTLGGSSPLTPWQEWREGGTLFDGPMFATHNPLEELSYRRNQLQQLRDSGQGESNLAVAIQANVTDLEKTTKGLAEQTEVFNREIGKGYKAYRSNVVDMADSLGLAGDSVKDFAYTLGAQDLNFQGLNPEQIQAKIAETFGKAGTDMAQQLLGTWKEVTDTVVNTYATEQMTQASDGAFQTDTTVTKRMEYQASVYAKTGETAIQTLTRLATSFNTLNEASDALGFGIHQGSLALADFADDFIEAFGGLEKFASTTNAYMQNFYSDDERKQGLLRAGARQANRLLGEKDKVTAESLEALGRDGFRAFVDGLVAGGGSPEEIRDAMDLGNMIAPAFASVEAQTPVVQELSNVVDELTQSYQNAIKSLTGDRDSLAVEVLRAQGDEAGAKALERTQYLAQFAGLDEIRLKEISTLYDLNQATREHVSVLKERNSLQDEINALTDTSAQALARQRDALDESNRALFDKLQATKLQQTIAQELPGVLDKFRTPGQRLEAGYSGISEGLAKAGVQISPADLAAASLPQILAAATELYNLGTTSDDTRLALIRAASGLADLKAQAVDMATSVTDAAYAALEREVGVRREVVQETIDDVRTVFDAVSSAAKSLYGDVGSTAKMLAGQGRSFIAEALSTAQLTGYLPDGKELQEAITAATSGIGKQVYATQLDADRERLILAGQLSALGDISGDQLTEQEKQLKALDGILEANREQIDAIRGIDVRVLGVDARIAMLTEAVLKEASVRGVTVPGATAPGATQPTGIYQGKLGARYDANTDTGYQSITGLPWSGASVRDAAKAMMEAGNARGLYDLAVKEGFSLATMDKILQIGDGTAEDWARAMKLPIFHEGTNFVPRTGVALLQQGEAVIPAAFNPFAGGSGVGNTALVAAVDRLTAQNAELLARLTQIEKHSKRTAAATNGRPDQPVPNYITNEKLVTV